MKADKLYIKRDKNSHTFRSDKLKSGREIKKKNSSCSEVFELEKISNSSNKSHFKKESKNNLEPLKGTLTNFDNFCSDKKSNFVTVERVSKKFETPHCNLKITFFS